MYAVISFAGHQYKVKQGDQLELNYLDAEVDSTVNVDTVLAMFDDAGKLELGTPNVEGKSVELKVLNHKKGDKVRVYKMKAKKRYRRNKGFRPMLTLVEVVTIGGKSTAKAAPKAETAVPKKAAAPKVAKVKATSEEKA